MPTRCLVGIHQPNFLPWLGFFRKLCRSDIFIILDDVQFPKTGGGTWVNRVKIMYPTGPAWLTVPVKRSLGGRYSCAEMLIDDSGPWRKKTLNTQKACYGRSPFFKLIFINICEETFANPSERLMDFNLAALRAVLNCMRLPADHLRLASDYRVGSASTQRLVDLVKSVGGTGYLSGDGAADYQQDELFAKNGLDLFCNNFSHPMYQQRGQEFTAGLSILDALFNTGPEAVRTMVKPKI